MRIPTAMNNTRMNKAQSWVGDVVRWRSLAVVLVVLTKTTNHGKNERKKQSNNCEEQLEQLKRP